MDTVEAVCKHCALCGDPVVDSLIAEPAQPLCANGVACETCSPHVRRYRLRVAAWAKHGMTPPALMWCSEPRRDVYGNRF